jgi:hypothetical protein
MSLNQRERELRRRISQSMSDTGSYNSTNKCKRLQRKLSKVQQQRKRNQRKWRN